MHTATASTLWPSPPMVRPSSQAPVTRRSKSGMQVSALTPLSPNLTAPLPAAASLELKAEKKSAHILPVYSVAFSPDGKTIVSGSDDKTIKVWSAGRLARTPPAPHRSHDPLWTHVCCRQNNARAPLVPHTQTLCSSSRSARAMAARSTRRVRARSRSATARPCASRRAAASSSTRPARCRASRCTGPGSSRVLHWPRLASSAATRGGADPLLPVLRSCRGGLPLPGVSRGSLGPWIRLLTYLLRRSLFAVRPVPTPHELSPKDR